MSAQHHQVFQTSSRTRWRRFKWTSRIFLVVGLFFFIVLSFALIKGYNPSLPSLEAKGREYSNKLDPTNPLTFSSKENKKYKGIRDFLIRKEKEDSIRKKMNHKENNAQKNPYIRAAFYSAWQANSPALRSLEKNGDKLNTIFPEWFFIDSTKGILNTRVDSAGLRLMRQYHLEIMPILSNFFTSRRKFDGDLVHSILTDSSTRKKFIRQLIDTLSFYKFQGLNIDFENLVEKSKQPLVNFLKDVKEAFGSTGLLLTVDVPPDDEDYDYKKIGEYADYVVLMAYDEFVPPIDPPGPISSQKWVEKSLDETVKYIPAEKIILGVAGYGHDCFDSTFSPISYNDAINKAKVVNAVIDYDNDNYNLHYSYTEEKENDDGEIVKVNHEVWFTDAATMFNILRFSDEYATAGSSLWVLGREDERIWKFYDRDLSNDGLAVQPFNFKELENIPVIPNNVSYDGDAGEVLNIIAKPEEGKIQLEIDNDEQIISEQNYIQLPSGYIIQRFAEDTTVGKGHKLILTFDDGPDPRYTPQILDILEKEKVPATFFIVGLQAEKNIPILQRIYKDGYEIGNHTFTHSNIAKMSPERADVEMKLTRLLIESITGRSTILFRAPFNADAEPRTYEELEPIARSHEENYLTINESVDPNDWKPGATADSIVLKTIKQVEERNASIILLHDAGGVTRQATVDALPGIIKYFKDRGYVFTTVADLMKKKKDDVMPPVPSSWVMSANFFLAEASYWIGQVLYSLFMIGIILSIGRMIGVAILAYRQKKKEKTKAITTAQPKVSIIVPAYNEEVSAVRTINSLLRQHYPDFEIIFVDDGSKDGTFKTVSETFLAQPKVKVFTKSNGGKSSALNFGISHCNTDFVVCIDADTQLKEDAVAELMKHFSTDDTGAVAGNVKVGNEINMLTRWQSIEYITAQNFDRRAFDLLDCITVVPGAIGAFRKQAVIDAGEFTSDTLAEDCDLTMRLHRCKYNVKNCTTAIAYTEAPEKLKGFLKQRFRWSFGIMQSFWKHRDAAFNPRYRNFGMVALPNILIFQILLPFLAPIADLVLAVSLLAASMNIIQSGWQQVVEYYLLFSLVDLAGAAVAFAFEKEDHKKLLWMIPQRFVYRQLMYYVLIKSIRRAIKGELQNWGKLKRSGNVKLETQAG